MGGEDRSHSENHHTVADYATEKLRSAHSLGGLPPQSARKKAEDGKRVDNKPLYGQGLWLVHEVGKPQNCGVKREKSSEAQTLSDQSVAHRPLRSG